MYLLINLLYFIILFILLFYYIHVLLFYLYVVYLNFYFTPNQAATGSIAFSSQDRYDAQQRATFVEDLDLDL